MLHRFVSGLVALSLLLIAMVAAPAPRVLANSGVPGPCLNDPNAGTGYSNFDIELWTSGKYPFMGVQAEWAFDGSMRTCTGQLPGGLNRYEQTYQLASLQHVQDGSEPQNIVQVGVARITHDDPFGNLSYSDAFVYTAADNGAGAFTIIAGITPTANHMYYYSIHNTGSHWALEIWDYTGTPYLLWSNYNVVNHWGNAGLMWTGAENHNLYSGESNSNETQFYTYARHTNGTTYLPYWAGSGQFFLSAGQPAWQQNELFNWPTYWYVTP